VSVNDLILERSRLGENENQQKQVFHANNLIMSHNCLVSTIENWNFIKGKRMYKLQKSMREIIL
jgi:hypothetical protein